MEKVYLLWMEGNGGKMHLQSAHDTQESVGDAAKELTGRWISIDIIPLEELEELERCIKNKIIS